MKILKFVFLLSITLSLAAPARGESPQFRFSGVDKKTEEKLRLELNGKNGSKPSMIDKVIRELMGTGRFANVSVSYRPEKNEYQVIAKPNILIRNISLTGNSVSAVESIPLPTGVAPGRPLNRGSLVRFAQQIKDLYVRLGFYNAKIDLEITKNENRAEVVLAITEGTPCRIRTIGLETENGFLQNLLEDFQGKFVDKRLDESLITEIKKKLRSTLRESGYIRSKVPDPDVSLSENRTVANIQFRIENPIRFDFFVTGNQSENFTSQTIIRELKNSSVADDSKKPSLFAKQFIESLYHAKGFANVKIEASEEKIEDAYRTEVKVNVVENQKVKISRIDISGIYSRPEKYYAEFIRNHSSDLVSDGIYNKTDLESGIENLLSELRNQGFLKAKVQSMKVKNDEVRSEIELDIHLVEGPLTQVQSIEFSGNKNFSALKLINALSIKNQEPLRLNELEKSIQSLIAFYQQNGFLEVEITNQKKGLVEYSQGHTQAKIEFKLREGPQIKTTKIIVRGNVKTKSYVVSRELEIKKGSILTPQQIRRSRINLEKLGLFSRVTIDTLEKGTGVADRTVIVEVQEKFPGVIRLGLGVTNERDLTVRGYVAHSYNNLWGTARAISSRAELNLNVADIQFPEHKVNVGYVEPYLFGSKYKGRIGLVRSMQINEFVQDQDQVIILEKNDINILLERELTDHLKLIYSVYKLSLTNFFELDDKVSPERNSVAKIGPALEWDYRDDKFNPREGFFSRLGIEYADPAFGSSNTVQFYKATTRASYYLPFAKKRWVWANSVRGGYLKNISNVDDSGVPVTEAFFLGGQSTIRGFESEANAGERIPKLQELGVDALPDVKITGESHFVLVKSELRFPLIDGFEGAIFYDGGLVGVSGFNFSDPYRDSVGVGIHIVTPVGPVNFEIGYKLDRNLAFNEKPWRFHFSIGSF